MRVIFLIALLALGNSLYCFSQCVSPSVNGSCLTPVSCVTLDPTFSFAGTFASGYSTVEMINANGIILPAKNFKASSTPTVMSCIVTYNITNVLTNYTYSVLGKFVSTDYIYKRYVITQPHYSIVIRFSMSFIGVWAPTDYLNLYTFDGATGLNFPMRYSCTDPGINYTQTICSSRIGNKVDCILSFTNTISHNSSSLLVNFSSLTSIKDSNVQYWGIFDLNIATVNCNPLCASCFSSNLTSTCTSCIVGNFLNINTCDPTCTGLLKLPNSNPLLGGFCVASCPPGYYVSAGACVACAAGCLSCTSATNCLLTANSVPQSSLWNNLLPLWIIIIVLGILAIIGIIWRLCFDKKTILNDQQQRIISENNDKQADEKLTTQERQEPLNISNNDKNIHIEQIDFNDHIMVDTNPRKRKRQERDMNRSNININF